MVILVEVSMQGAIFSFQTICLLDQQSQGIFLASKKFSSAQANVPCALVKLDLSKPSRMQGVLVVAGEH